MRLSTLAVIASASSLLIAAPASAGPADDAAAFVSKAVDQFNAGDVKAWLAAQADDPLIVDEFAPHVWSGAGSAQR